MMRIGKLAKLSGATPKALRLYESMGLIPPPIRQGNYRIYTDKDVVLVHMIRRGQAAGFSLAELKTLLESRTNTGLFPLLAANELIEVKQRKLHHEMGEIITLNQHLMDLREELNRTYGQLNEKA